MTFLFAQNTLVLHNKFCLQPNNFIMISAYISHYYLKILILILGIPNLAPLSDQDCQCNANQNTDARIEAVFFAQTHVLEPTSPYFKLVGAREALIKVNISSPSNAAAIPVCAYLELQGRKQKLCLNGPAKFPRQVAKDQHSFDNSYTATIPADWIWSGLKVKVQVGEQSKEFDNLNIGADTRGRFRYFDFLVFGDTKPTEQLTEGFYKEITSKLPIIGLDRIDAGDFDLPVVSILAYKNQPARIANRDAKDNWHGMTFSMTMLRELAKANGECYTTIYIGAMSTAGGGWGGGNNFSGIINPGVFWHELGHSYSLLHSDSNKDFPYKGDNISQFDFHAGPTWAYDPIQKKFIPATIQENAVGELEYVGRYKRDPQWGGGAGDQEKGYFVRHYSDYNTWLMQKYMENNLDRKDPSANRYERWNDTQKRWVTSDRQSWNYPIQENIPVYTVWGTSSVTADANIIYDPIEYKGNLVELFDPRKPEDLKKMIAENYCHPCNLSVKIIQGGKEKWYVINNNFDPNAKEGDFFELRGWAVNVPVADGKIEKVELYQTPALNTQGFPSQLPKAMAVWPETRIFAVPLSIGNRVWHDKNKMDCKMWVNRVLRGKIGALARCRRRWQSRNVFWSKHYRRKWLLLFYRSGRKHLSGFCMGGR
ncbi:MAG: hypothetical protein HC913_20620 [Microscillaceae bacterium]|nr:hypothetical protein [Microscillaceae bacterium]